MSKATLSIGYTHYVLDLKDAVTIAEILSAAELYESTYKDRASSHHIYGNDSSGESMVIKLLADDFYRLAKLAGKPEK